MVMETGQYLLLLVVVARMCGYFQWDLFLVVEEMVWGVRTPVSVYILDRMWSGALVNLRLVWVEEVMTRSDTQWGVIQGQ